MKRRVMTLAFALVLTISLFAPLTASARVNLVPTMPDSDLKALNIFFSSFISAHLMDFDDGSYTMESVVSFAINYTLKNHYSTRVTYGNYSGYEARISASFIEQTIEEFLGIKNITHKSITKNYLDYKYDNGYYYLNEAFGDPLKWAQVTEFYDNGDGTFSAVMDIYGSHEPPENRFERISKWNVRSWRDVWVESSAVKEFSSAAICKPYNYNGKDTYILTKLIYGQKTAPAPAAPPPNAIPTKSSLSVDGSPVSVDMYLINNENNYLKVRDLAYMLNATGKQFEVGYDANLKTVLITSGAPYTAVGGEMALGDGSAVNAQESSYSLLFDGKPLDLTVYLIGGNNYYKLRDLCKALDVYVGYNDETRAITLNTDNSYAD